MAFTIFLIIACIGMQLISHKTNPTTINVIMMVKIDNLAPMCYLNVNNLTEVTQKMNFKEKLGNQAN